MSKDKTGPVTGATPEAETQEVAAPALETQKTAREQDGVAVTEEQSVVQLADLGTKKAKGADAAQAAAEADTSSSSESEEEKKKKRPSQSFDSFKEGFDADKEGQSFAEFLGVKEKDPKKLEGIMNDIDELNAGRDVGKEGVIVASVTWCYNEDGSIQVLDAKGDLSRISLEGKDGKTYAFNDKGELTADGKVQEQAQTQTATVTQDAPAVESPAKSTPAKEPKETEAPALQTSSRETDGVTTQKKRIPPQSVPSAEPASEEKAKESQTFEQWKDGIEKDGKSFAEHIGVDKANPNFDKIANDIEKLNAGRDVGKDGIVVAKATYEFDKDGKPVIKEAQGDLSRISIEGKDGKTYGFDEKGELVEKKAEQTTAVTKDAPTAAKEAETAAKDAPATAQPEQRASEAPAPTAAAKDAKAPETTAREGETPAATTPAPATKDAKAPETTAREGETPAATAPVPAPKDAKAPETTAREGETPAATAPVPAPKDAKAPEAAKKDEPAREGAAPAPARSGNNELDSIVADLKKGGVSGVESTASDRSASAPIVPHNAPEADKGIA